MKAQILKPTDRDFISNKITVFLAGSIEMGAAKNWQQKTEERLKYYPVTIFNPRIDLWDTSWKQRETNPEFNHQVNWELNHLEQADIIFMYLSHNTKSPISLLELGLFSDRKIIVCCPVEFYRRGNVEIVCARKRIPLYSNLDEALGALITTITLFQYRGNNIQNLPKIGK